MINVATARVWLKGLGGYSPPTGSSETLHLLSQAIGESKRDRVVAEQAQLILEGERLSYQDAAFLLEVGRLEQAEGYVLQHRDRLDGTRYSALVPIAEGLERDGRLLGATVICRALLESILDRARAKYYHHGIRYLNKLDRLAPKIEDWGTVPPHDRYKHELLEEHGRKWSFWSKYGL